MDKFMSLYKQLVEKVEDESEDQYLKEVTCDEKGIKVAMELEDDGQGGKEYEVEVYKKGDNGEWKVKEEHYCDTEEEAQSKFDKLVADNGLTDVAQDSTTDEPKTDSTAEAPIVPTTDEIKPLVDNMPMEESKKTPEPAKK